LHALYNAQQRAGAAVGQKTQPIHFLHDRALPADASLPMLTPLLYPYFARLIMHNNVQVLLWDKRHNPSSA
jgi:hypothetical protein